MKRRLIMLLFISSALCLAGCSGIGNDEKNVEAQEDKRVTVKVDTPKTGSISIDGDFIGTVESEEQVYVVSKASGDVTDTFFEVGDYVNEGDLMFTVDDTAAQISYRQAEASLSSANASLKTANASVNTANANVTAQTASVTENFAKTKTTDKQLQIAIDNQEVNFANAEINIGTLEDSLDTMKDRLDSVEDTIEKAKAGIGPIQAAYTEAAAKAAQPEATQADKDKAEELKKELASAQANLGNLESTKDTLKSQIKQTESSISTSKNSKCLIVENADLARAQKNDYDTYTKTTIGTGGLSTLAQAQAGVIQAEASVTQSKAGIATAQASVDSAKLQLDNTNITAPVSGIVTSKGVTKNNMTSTGSVAYTIMSDGSKFVTFLVSEDVMKELFEGQSITVDRNGNMYDAVITENPGVADEQTGLFKVKAKINEGEDIICGVKVKITMATQHADNVMTVPIDAVYHENEKSYVYTYADGKANKAYVETGLFDNEKIEIINGLTDSDQVITTWNSQLRNGVEVKLENSVSMNDSTAEEIVVERN